MSSLKALNKSIEKWATIYDYLINIKESEIEYNKEDKEILVDEFHEDCPLCNEITDLKDRQYYECGNCCIMQLTGGYQCDNTPYYKIRQLLLYGFYDIDYIDRLINLIEDMLKILYKSEKYCHEEGDL